jgi:hypothetical protein
MGIEIAHALACALGLSLQEALRISAAHPFESHCRNEGEQCS